MLARFRAAGRHSTQNQTYQLWQHTNHPIWLNYDRIYDQKEKYIHQNPVKAGFVNEAHEWRMSSANVDGPIEVIVR